MPVKKSPDARDVTMSARFSVAEAAEIDAARGSINRNLWLRDVVLAAARGGHVRPGAAEPSRRRTAARKASLPVFRKPEITEAASAGPAAREESCPHPKARVLKGMCHACGTYVG